MDRRTRLCLFLHPPRPTQRAAPSAKQCTGRLLLAQACLLLVCHLLRRPKNAIVLHVLLWGSQQPPTALPCLQALQVRSRQNAPWPAHTSELMVPLRCRTTSLPLHAAARRPNVPQYVEQPSSRPRITRTQSRAFRPRPRSSCRDRRQCPTLPPSSASLSSEPGLPRAPRGARARARDASMRPRATCCARS